MSMIQVRRKLKLANGRVVEGKLFGDKGGDVWEILVKYRGKYITAHALAKIISKKKVFPVKSISETPFIDIDVVKKK